MYIFDKYGTLLHYGEWNRLKQSGITKDEVCIIIITQFAIVHVVLYCRRPN